MKRTTCYVHCCCALIAPNGCVWFHPGGMAAISPGSRSASGVGMITTSPRPRRGRSASAIRRSERRASTPPGSDCLLPPPNRWWRCAYHRLMAENPPGSFLGFHRPTLRLSGWPLRANRAETAPIISSGVSKYYGLFRAIFLIAL